MKHKKHFFTIFFVLIFSLLFFNSSNAQDVNCSTQECIDTWATYTGTVNSISISGTVTNLTPLSGITSVSTYVRIVNNTELTTLHGLEYLTHVGTFLDILGNDALKDLDGLEGLTSVSRTLAIQQNAVLTNLDGLQNLTSVRDLNIMDNDALTNLDGLRSLMSVRDISINENVALTNLDGLHNLTSVGRDLYIMYNDALTNLDGLGSLISAHDITITHNSALVSFCRLYPLCNSGNLNPPHINNNSPYTTTQTIATIIAAGPCPVKVVDIYPGTCPNSFNVGGKGNIPVAILGTDDFDVQDIDATTLLLEGISPLRWSFEDVAAPISGSQECYCTIEGPDGFDDLNIKFDAQELAAALGQVNDGDELVLTITGDMLDGTPIEGSDCVVIIAKNLNKGLAENLSQVPQEYALFDNFPNPFNPTTKIKYQIPELNFVTLKVYDLLGSEIGILVNEEMPAGIYEVEFDAMNLPSGIYFYILQAGSFVETKKMILMK